MGVDQGAQPIESQGRVQLDSRTLCATTAQASKSRTDVGRMTNSMQDSTLQPVPWEVITLTTRPVLAKLLVQGGSLEREDWWVSPMDLPRDRGYPVHGQQLEMVGLQWVGWTMETKLGMTRA
jgi:hypothetical protein